MEETQEVSQPIRPLKPKGAWWIRQGNGNWAWMPPFVSRAERKAIKSKRKQAAKDRRKAKRK